jgi:hypothetical protein
MMCSCRTIVSRRRNFASDALKPRHRFEGEIEHMSDNDVSLSRHYASKAPHDSIDAETLVAIIESRELPIDVLENIAAILAERAAAALYDGETDEGAAEHAKQDRASQV